MLLPPGSPSLTPSSDRTFGLSGDNAPGLCDGCEAAVRLFALVDDNDNWCCRRDGEPYSPDDADECLWSLQNTAWQSLALEPCSHTRVPPMFLLRLAKARAATPEANRFLLFRAFSGDNFSVEIMQQIVLSFLHDSTPHGAASFERSLAFMDQLGHLRDEQPLWAYRGGLPDVGSCVENLPSPQPFNFSRREEAAPWSMLPIWSMLPTFIRTELSLPESSVDCRGHEYFGKTCVFTNVCYHKERFWYTSDDSEEDTYTSMFDPISAHNVLAGLGAVRVTPYGMDMVINRHRRSIDVRKASRFLEPHLVSWVPGTTLWAADMSATSTLGHPLEFAAKLPGVRKQRFLGEPIDQMAVRYRRQHKVAEELLRIAFDDNDWQMPPIHTVFDTLTWNNRSYAVCQGGCDKAELLDGREKLSVYEDPICFERLLVPSPAHKDFEGVQEASLFKVSAHAMCHTSALEPSDDDDQRGPTLTPIMPLDSFGDWQRPQLNVFFLQRSFTRGIYGWEGSRADGRTIAIGEVCALINKLAFQEKMQQSSFVATVVPVELLSEGVCINAHLAAQADIVVMTEGSHAGFVSLLRDGAVLVLLHPYRGRNPEAKNIAFYAGVRTIEYLQLDPIPEYNVGDPRDAAMRSDVHSFDSLSLRDCDRYAYCTFWWRSITRIAIPISCSLST